MGIFDINPSTYARYNFIEIPEGDHRVRISKVRFKRCRNDKKFFEITFKVSRCCGKLWYRMWHNPEYIESSTRTFEKFFDSFQIQDRDHANYKSWIGKEGGVHVKHIMNYNKVTGWDTYTAQIVCCICKENYDKLPPWSDVPEVRFSEDVF